MAGLNAAEPEPTLEEIQREQFARSVTHEAVPWVERRFDYDAGVARRRCARCGALTGVRDSRAEIFDFELLHSLCEAPA